MLFLSLVAAFSPRLALISRGCSKRFKNDQTNKIKGVGFDFSSGFFLRFGEQRKHLASDPMGRSVVVEWTTEDVAARFAEAVETGRRLPRVKVQGYFNVWPAFAREVWESSPDDDHVYRSLPPSPQAIERMMETMRWVFWWRRSNGISSGCAPRTSTGKSSHDGVADMAEGFGYSRCAPERSGRNQCARLPE